VGGKNSTILIQEKTIRPRTAYEQKMKLQSWYGVRASIDIRTKSLEGRVNFFFFCRQLAQFLVHELGMCAIVHRGVQNGAANRVN